MTATIENFNLHVQRWLEEIERRLDALVLPSPLPPVEDRINQAASKLASHDRRLDAIEDVLEVPLALAGQNRDDRPLNDQEKIDVYYPHLAAIGESARENAALRRDLDAMIVERDNLLEEAMNLSASLKTERQWHIDALKDKERLSANSDSVLARAAGKSVVVTAHVEGRPTEKPAPGPIRCGRPLGLSERPCIDWEGHYGPCQAPIPVATALTAPDHEVERMAELAWRVFVGHGAAQWRATMYREEWRAVVRAILADRAAQERDAAREKLGTALQAERDAEHEAAERHMRQRDDARNERDDARELLTDAEHTRDMALSRNDELEHDCDALQSRLGALRREPTKGELETLARALFSLQRQRPVDYEMAAALAVCKAAWTRVRDALLGAPQGHEACSWPCPECDEHMPAQGPCWMMERCGTCGHRLRGSASHCPQCGSVATAIVPETYPDTCPCARCTDARSLLTAQEHGEDGTAVGGRHPAEPSLAGVTTQRAPVPAPIIDELLRSDTFHVTLPTSALIDSYDRSYRKGFTDGRTCGRNQADAKLVEELTARTIERDALQAEMPSKGKLWVEGRLVDVPMLLAVHEDLQARLGALRREPTATEVLNLFYMSRDWKADQGDTERIWAFVRDALLTAQELDKAASSSLGDAQAAATPAPAPKSPWPCPHGKREYDPPCLACEPAPAPAPTSDWCIACGLWSGHYKWCPSRSKDLDTVSAALTTIRARAIAESEVPASTGPRCKHGIYERDAVCLRCVSYESGRAAERAAVVAWCEKFDDEDMGYRAMCIERGDHAVKGEKS